MRKIVMLNRVSLDGFFAGPNGEIDWFIHDPEVDKAAHEMMQPDTLLLGRLTYQMFESYWPNVVKDPNASQGARATADELNQMTKVVFSKTLREVTWVNTRLVKDDLLGEVKKLKSGGGPDITIFGSGTLWDSRQMKLIDEYLITVTPVVLGKGKPLFKDVKNMNLALIESRNFNSETFAPLQNPITRRFQVKVSFQLPTLPFLSKPWGGT
jgi:dihydrofolate reductase